MASHDRQELEGLIQEIAKRDAYIGKLCRAAETMRGAAEMTSWAAAHAEFPLDKVEYYKGRAAGLVEAAEILEREMLDDR